MKIFKQQPLAVAIVLGSLTLIACDVDVQDRGKDKNVDVRTPFGDISVHKNEGGSDTGLPVYPGAKPLKDEDEEPESAEVKIGTSFFGMQLAAAKFESSDAPQAIVDFYKDKMAQYGTVVECKGDVEFKGEPKEPVCEEDLASHETQLVAGTEESHRLVSVKPRGSGSEFAVVSIHIDERS